MSMLFAEQLLYCHEHFHHYQSLIHCIFALKGVRIIAQCLRPNGIPNWWNSQLPDHDNRGKPLPEVNPPLRSIFPTMAMPCRAAECIRIREPNLPSTKKYFFVVLLMFRDS